MKAPAVAEAHTQPQDSTPADDAADEIRSYQRASRRIVQDSTLTLQQACVALIRLAVRARQQAQAPELVQDAVWSEARVFVEGGTRPLDRESLLEALVATDPVEQAIRAQLRKQHVRCETCLRLLPTEKELDHRRTLTRAALQDALLREEAV